MVNPLITDGIGLFYQVWRLMYHLLAHSALVYPFWGERRYESVSSTAGHAIIQPDTRLFVEAVHVLFKVTLFIGGLVFVDDAFRRETVEVALHVVEEFAGGLLVLR